MTLDFMGLFSCHFSIEHDREIHAIAAEHGRARFHGRNPE